MKNPMKGTFRSLAVYNYRVWASGAIISNTGTWMQRTAQDWIVLTELTDHNSTAVGIVMGLQFGPQLLMLPFTGFAADYFDRRKLVMVTQALMGLLGLGLGLLTITGLIELWHVYVFAFLLGCVAAFDAPARQTFVSDLVPEHHLSNAIALNSTSFNAARMIGPAVAGVLIAFVGTGWVFLLNSASFIGVLWSLMAIRTGELNVTRRPLRGRGNLVSGFRYVAARPDLMAIFLMLFLIGTFGLNFPIFISTMAVTVFHAGAGEYGMLSSMMAVGTVMGALFAAQRATPQIGLLFYGALVFGVGCIVAAVMPSYWLFGASLVIIGIAALTFMSSSNGLIQLSTDPMMRGRVMAIRMAIAMGGTPIGAPIVGWIADQYGPRWALGVAALSGIAAAIVGLVYLFKYRELRIRRVDGRLRILVNEVPKVTMAAE